MVTGEYRKKRLCSYNIIFKTFQKHPTNHTIGNMTLVIDNKPLLYAIMWNVCCITLDLIVLNSTRFLQVWLILTHTDLQLYVSIPRFHLKVSILFIFFKSLLLDLKKEMQLEREKKIFWQKSCFLAVWLRYSNQE